MSDVRLVIHGHFYQPPRENPWTEEVAVEPSAAPFHDWNERITSECYRPNGWARVLDEHGRVADIIDNYEHLSFNFGPTLLSWLEAHAPEVYERVLHADRVTGGAIAQGYSHLILPLATERDVRTQVRWGLADFEHRFGRRARGMWLPETAVNDDVLRVLVEEGVGFTILAPNQALAVRPFEAEEWTDVSDGSIAGGEPFRWFHPDGDGRFLDLLFYDGGISHDLAFGLTGLSSQELIRRVVDAAADGSPVCVATDGETFGHHHKWADRALAYAFIHESEPAGVRVLNAAALLDEVAPTHEVKVRESAWSCVHGVGRWKEDCGCSTGGEPGWNQAWRAPLRAALDVIREHGVDVFERRGVELLHDPWGARDAYIGVILGRRSIDDFLGEHLRAGADRVTALVLLEAQRHAQLMYTSCGWFFNDLAGIETLQVLRYAARTMDLLAEAGEPVDEERFFSVLREAHSNDPDEGDGVAIWKRHVEPSRVDAARVVAHLALVSLLEQGEPPGTLAAFTVLEHHRRNVERGSLNGVVGLVTLEHGRTLRTTQHIYAAVHFGGLEVFGATREAEPGRDTDELLALAHAVVNGERVATVLRQIADSFGPHEFGLESALPDAADQIVRGAADQLVDRFSATYEHLYRDTRPVVGSLLLAGYPLPRELRAAAEFALARRFETEIAAAVDHSTAASFDAAQEIVAEARRAGLQLVTPRAAELMGRSLLSAVDRAVESPDDEERVAAALALLRLARELDLHLALDLERAQETVLEARRAQPDHPGLARLARPLGLMV
jgi:alpha-amylase/alpha-mannosidase (GH57 family)